MNARNVNPTLSTLNNKSSVLCPETRHITSQYLALEQLEAHSRMVSHAKGSVDTAPPKSLQSYLSSINSRKKRLWKNKMSFEFQSNDVLSNFSEPGTVPRIPSVDNKHVEDEDLGNDSLSLNKSIQAGFPFPKFSSKVADKITWYLEAISQGEFRPVPSNSFLQSEGVNRISNSQLSLSSSLRSNRVVKGDLLDFHKNCFTPAGQQPRILSNNHTKSKLLGMKCYNPPRRERKSNSINSSDTFESSDDDDGDNNDEEFEEQQEEEEVEEEQDHTMEKEESVSKMHQIGNLRQNSTDDWNWLREQELRAQVRRKFKSQLNFRQNSSIGFRRNTERTPRLGSLDPSHVLNRYEEEKYLKFLCDVTEDILRSGVYTDRSIQRTFEFHLQFYPKDTDKEKLRQLLDQVLEGLQVSADDSDDPFKTAAYVLSVKDTSSYSSTPPEKEIIDPAKNLENMSRVLDEDTQEPLGNSSQNDTVRSLRT